MLQEWSWSEHFAPQPETLRYLSYSRVTAAHYQEGTRGAITGSFDRIDIKGLGGLKLKDKWGKGPQTFLGNLPNMLMLMGPHTALGNIPRSIKYNVEWVTGLIRHMRDRNLTRADVRSEAVVDWTDYVKAKGAGPLSNEVDPWMTDINSNVEGK